MKTEIIIQKLSKSSVLTNTVTITKILSSKLIYIKKKTSDEIVFKIMMVVMNPGLNLITFGKEITGPLP